MADDDSGMTGATHRGVPDIVLAAWVGHVVDPTAITGRANQHTRQGENDGRDA